MLKGVDVSGGPYGESQPSSRRPDPEPYPAHAGSGDENKGQHLTAARRRLAAQGVQYWPALVAAAGGPPGRSERAVEGRC